MYYPYFLTYILTGVVISAFVFVWALRNDQFKDQQRARFLPLEPGDASGSDGTARGRRQIVAILIFVVVGIGSSFAAVLYALLTR